MTDSPQAIVVKNPSSTASVAFQRAASGDIGDELRREVRSFDARSRMRLAAKTAPFRSSLGRRTDCRSRAGSTCTRFPCSAALCAAGSAIARASVRGDGESTDERTIRKEPTGKMRCIPDLLVGGPWV
jgi:hypothetical protein